MPLELPLRDFLECFPPPQLGKIVVGYEAEFDAHDTFDIPRGSVLNFHRKVNPNVPLSFRDPWSPGGDNWVRVTLPLEFQGKFRLMPYDPATEDYDDDHLFPTVEELIKAFPVYVQANCSFGDKENHPRCAFECGDRFKLIRLVYRDGEKYLECRALNESRLILLPLYCEGDFTVLPDNNEYLLADLVSMLPRRRRVQVALDENNKTYKIPGLPANFDGDLFVEEPEAFVEASPTSEPGLTIGLPHDLEMTISPEDTAYERGQLLNTFATNNRNLFPIVARVTDWNEETSILENHFIKPGIEMVIHGWTRQSKVLAQAADAYYAVPLTYQGKFRIKPKQFYGVADLEHVYPGYRLRVVGVDQQDTDFPLNEGDVIRIKREDSVHKNFKDATTSFLKCDKFEGNGKIREFKLPFHCNAVFEEVLEQTRATDFWIRELVSFVSDQELVVELIKPSPDQKNTGRDLPMNIPIVLCDFVIEPAVYVSSELPESPAFHIPLRTLIYVSFIAQLERSASPLLTKQNPRLSTLDRCAEILPPDVFHAHRSNRGGVDDPATFTANRATQWYNNKYKKIPARAASFQLQGKRFSSITNFSCNC